MKNKLITALRLSAQTLLSGRFSYDWNFNHSCNAGVLTCALTNKAPAELQLHLKPMAEKLPAGVSPTWTNLLSFHCPLTGFSSNEIFTTLQAAGLTREDMQDLEYLRNEKVLARMPQRFRITVASREFPYIRMGFRPHRNNRIDCAHYLSAWADLLVEEGRLDQPHAVTAADKLVEA